MVVALVDWSVALAAATVVFSGADSVFTKHVLMSPFMGVTYSGSDDVIYKCPLNSAQFADCLPTYFEAIGYNITTPQAQNISDMITSALEFYIDPTSLDSSYQTVNLLVRDAITWVVEDSAAITDNQTRAQINSVLDTVNQHFLFGSFHV